MSARTTCAPLECNARAVANPMPLAPPVITAPAPAKSVNAIPIRLLSPIKFSNSIQSIAKSYLVEGLVSNVGVSPALKSSKVIDMYT